MSKIKVLHIIKSLGRGGAEMLLPETISVHDSDAFEFHVIYFLPWKNQMVESIQMANGTVTCFAATNNIRILLQFRKVAAYVKEHRIDVIHCHLPWAGFLGRLIYKFTGVPVLYTEHNKQERYHILTKLLNRFTFNWQTAGIAVSEEVASSIKNNIHPSVPVLTILNGINTEKFVVRRPKRLSAESTMLKAEEMQNEEQGRRNEESLMLNAEGKEEGKNDPWENGREIRRSLGIMDDEVVIGTMAVFRFQKRLDLWLEVFSEIRKQHSNVKGIIVGDGPLKELIHEKHKQLQLEGVVFLPGLQTNQMDWLSAMDIYMMSSVFEGLPIALLEAMSCGIPVICTNAGGTGEVIRDNIDGFLVPVDEPMLLVNKAEQLITNIELRNQLGIAARKRTIDEFSMQRMVKDLEGLYRKVVKEIKL